MQPAPRADASDFLKQIEQATAALRAEREKKSIRGGSVNGGLVEIQELEILAIVSDLHGDSKSLSKILGEINYEMFLKNPLNMLVFVGYFVDWGSDSIGILHSVCRLKHQYPDSVVLMRGNHESPAELPFPSHDLPYKLEERFGQDSRGIYERLLSMFRLLTLATIVRDKLLLIHGGLPTEDAAIANYREAIATAQENHIRSRTLEELLWNDPRKLGDLPGWEASRRGVGRHFGSAISRKWLEASGTKAIVRGHEPCQGFRLDHDDTVLTLFSCKEAYPAFKAAYLMLGSGDLQNIRDAKDLSNCVRFPA